MNRILAITSVILLVLVLIPAITSAADEESVGGTFETNNTPGITVSLYTTDTLLPTSAMNPLTEYDARVSVTDSDGITDLGSIEVKIWYDGDGGSASESDFDGIAAGNTQTAVIITWTESSNTFSIDPSASTTWSLGAGSVAPVDLTGEFHFKFTVGKAATITSGAARWQIAARVIDDTPQTAWAADAEGATMAWYGEISGVSGTVSWGQVNPGMNFAEGAPSEQALGGTPVKYISNGPYDEKVRSSATWTSGSTTVTLVASETLTANQFALRADDTSTLASAVLVDDAGVAIDVNAAQTGESGEDVGTNTLWLKLASTFAKGDYTGTITYIIAQGT